MRILVVGCRGMLGSDLVDELSPAHTVAGVDLPETDITRRASVDAALRDAQPDMVVNCAAYTRVDDCETHRDLAFAANAEGARNVARACREAGIGLVHLSTDYVFGGEGTRPWRESDPVAPRGVYAESKRAGEEAVVEEMDEGSWTTIRTQWLFGRRGPNFVEAILRQVARGAVLRVVHDQRGRPTWTRHLARGIRTLIEPGEGLGFVHLANSGEATWYDFACEIVRASGATDVRVEPVATRDVPRPAPRPAYSVLDLTLFERLAGKPLPSWRDALAGYLRERT